MAIAFGAIGTKVILGTTTAAIAYPAGLGAADMAVAGRAIWNTLAASGADEAGWVNGGELFGGNAGGGADNHRITARADTRQLSGAESGSVTFDQNSTPDGVCGVMARYTKAVTETWAAVQSTTGDDATQAADRSIAGSGNLTLAPGDMVVVVVATNTDTSLTVTSPAITAAGITFGTTNRRTSGAGSVTGQDGNVEIFDALVSSGSGTVAPTLTFTTATSQSGPAVFLRLRVVTVAAENAAVTATAQQPTTRVKPNAGSAAVTATAQQPAPSVKPNAGSSAVAVTANQPTTTVKPSGGVAAVTAAAQQPAPSVRANAGVASVSAAALDATIRVGTSVAAECATVTVTAHQPTTKVSPAAGAATVAAVAQAATATVRTTAAPALVDGTTDDPTVVTGTFTNAQAECATVSVATSSTTQVRATAAPATVAAAAPAASVRVGAAAALAEVAAVIDEAAARISAGALVAAVTGTAGPPTPLVYVGGGLATVTVVAGDVITVPAVELGQLETVVTAAFLLVVEVTHPGDLRLYGVAVRAAFQLHVEVEEDE